jgi:hypothetical protein
MPGHQLGLSPLLLVVESDHAALTHLTDHRFRVSNTDVVCSYVTHFTYTVALAPHMSSAGRIPFGTGKRSTPSTWKDPSLTN